jgi:hypothetical protein
VVNLVRLVRRVCRDRQAHRVRKEILVSEVKSVRPDPQDQRDPRGQREVQGLQVRRELPDRKAIPDLRESKGLQDLKV